MDAKDARGIKGEVECDANTEWLALRTDNTVTIVFLRVLRDESIS